MQVTINANFDSRRHFEKSCDARLGIVLVVCFNIRMVACAKQHIVIRIFCKTGYLFKNGLLLLVHVALAPHEGPRQYAEAFLMFVISDSFV